VTNWSTVYQILCISKPLVTTCYTSRVQAHTDPYYARSTKTLGSKLHTHNSNICPPRRICMVPSGPASARRPSRSARASERRGIMPSTASTVARGTAVVVTFINWKSFLFLVFCFFTIGFVPPHKKPRSKKIGVIWGLIGGEKEWRYPTCNMIAPPRGCFDLH